MKLITMILAHLIIAADATTGIYNARSALNLPDREYDVFVDIQGHRDLILILGDKDGMRAELALNLYDSGLLIFGRNDDRPDYIQPIVIDDKKTATLIIDIPSFGDIMGDVQSAILYTFVNKIIFEQATRMKIVLVMPESEEHMSRWTRMVTQLAHIVDKDAKYFYRSVGVVGTISPQRQGVVKVEEVMSTLRKEVNSIFDKNEAVGKLMGSVRGYDNFAVFARGGEKERLWRDELKQHELRQFVFGRLNYGWPVKENIQLSRSSFALDTLPKHELEVCFTYSNDSVELYLSKVVSDLLGASIFDDAEESLHMLEYDKHASEPKIFTHYESLIMKIDNMSNRAFVEYVTERTESNWNLFRFHLEYLEMLSMLCKDDNFQRDDYDAKNRFLSALQSAQLNGLVAVFHNNHDSLLF